jgi:tRNA pseudouridine55 synthase
MGNRLDQSSSSRKVVRRPVHGLVLLDKPLGLSSNQALQKVKCLLRAEKAGHTGTLDPLASGVLPLCFGAATKFSQLHLDADKSYEAIALLGATTSTGDAEGEVLQRRPVQVGAEELERVRVQFQGEIRQVPPMHSALKKDGRPLYEYARAGIEVEREARTVFIRELTLALVADGDVQTLRMQVRCSKGTYIRTLAEDIGEALGCGAHLTLLRRVETGGFGIAECVTLAQLEAWPDEDRLQALRPVEDLLADHGQIMLEPEDAGRFLSGVRRRGKWPDNPRVAVFGLRPHALLGTAHVAAGELIPDRLLNPTDIEQILARTVSNPIT